MLTEKEQKVCVDLPYYCKTFRNSVYLLKKLYILNALGIVGARSVGKQLAASNEAERRNPEKPDLAKQGNAQDIKEF